MKQYLFILLLIANGSLFAQELVNPYISQYNEKYDYQLQRHKRLEQEQTYQQWLEEQQTLNQVKQDKMNPQKRALKDEADKLSKNMDDLQKDNPADAILAKQRLIGLQQLMRFMN